VVSASLLGALAGSACAFVVGDRLGRKRELQLGAALYGARRPLPERRTRVCYSWVLCYNLAADGRAGGRRARAEAACCLSCQRRCAWAVAGCSVGR